MPLEKEGYRDQLERIIAKFPNREVLKLPEVAAFVGLKRDTLLKDKRFPAKKVAGVYIIPITALARWLS